MSRSGRSCIFGKRTSRIETKVDEETHEKFSAIAQSFRMTDSEFLNELIMLRVHGKKKMEEAYLERVRCIATTMDGE